MPAEFKFDSSSDMLNKIIAGDESAFRNFYEENFDRVAKYTFKICKSEIVTEEIVQEVFYKVWTCRSTLLHVNNIEAYVFSIAKNKTIDFLRRLAKETVIISELSNQLTELDNVINEKLDADSLKQEIELALNSLSDQKRRIFEMSKIQGYSHHEIAESLQLSKSTVKNHLSETLKHLKKQIINNPNKNILLLLFYIGHIWLKK